MSYNEILIFIYIHAINHIYLHCTSTLIVAGSEVPTVVLAVQLYDPDLLLCMLEIVYLGPLWRTILGLSVLIHLQVMLVFGFASVTVHISVAVFPSITLYGLDGLDFTSGLSIKIPSSLDS